MGLLAVVSAVTTDYKWYMEQEWIMLMRLSDKTELAPVKTLVSFASHN